MCAALRRGLCVGTFLYFGLSAAAYGATVPGETATTPAPSTMCELHAWPSRDFHTTYYGWAHGGTTDASLKGRKGYPAVIPDMLTAAQQVAKLRTIDLPQTLGLQGYRPHIHAEALGNSVIRETTGRHDPGAGDCYAELIIEGVTLQEDYFSGKFLNVMYRLRRFHEQAAPDSTFGTFITTRLLTPLSGKDTMGPEALSAKAAEAFGQSLITFGAIAQRAMALHDKTQLRKGEKK